MFVGNSGNLKVLCLLPDLASTGLPLVIRKWPIRIDRVHCFDSNAGQRKISWGRVAVNEKEFREHPVHKTEI